MLLRTDGQGNIAAPILINNGTGPIVLAAGSDLPAGNGSGGQVIFSDPQLSNSRNNGSLYIYSGDYAAMGNLNRFNPLTPDQQGFSNLFFNSSDPAHLNNVGFNKAYTGDHNALPQGAAHQIVFRSNPLTTPIFTLNPGSVSKIYGNSDPTLANLQTRLQTEYTGPNLLTGSLGVNTFSLAASEVWNRFGLGPRLNGEDVGTYSYAVLPTSSSALQDVFASVSTPKLNITPRPITITATAYSKEYDGTPNVSAAPTLTDGTLAAWDSVPVTQPWSQTFDSAGACAAGLNCRTVTPFNLVIQDTASGRSSAGNYQITLQTANGRISPAPLTIQVNDDAKLRSTNDASGYNGFSIVGLKSGDRASVLAGLDSVSITRSNASVQDAGTYSQVLEATGSVSSPNYQISYAKGNYTILPYNHLLVKAQNLNSVYGQQVGTGLDDFAYQVTSAQYVDAANPGVAIDVPLTSVGGNTFSRAGSPVFTLGTLGYTASSAGRIPVGTYRIGPVGAVSTAPEFSGGISIVGSHSVLRKRLEVTLTDPSKIYDGTTAIQGTQAGTSNRLLPDAVFGRGIGATSQTDVGENVAFSVTNIYLQGADANNYYMPGGSFSGNNGRIVPRPLTVTLSDHQKVYGNWFDPRAIGQTSNIPSSEFTATGLAPGESIDQVLIGSAGMHPDAHVGNYALTGSGAIAPVGNAFKSSNYAITYSPANLSVTPAPLLVVGERLYDGTTVMVGSQLTALGANGQFFDMQGAGAQGNLASKDVQFNGLISSFQGLSLGQAQNGALASNYLPLEYAQSGVDILHRPLVVTSGITASDKTLTGAGDNLVAALQLNNAQFDQAIPGDTLRLEGVTGSFES
ncbi:MAG: YDG domain-containing protein, partial [Limnohabitans sp.]